MFRQEPQNPLRSLQDVDARQVANKTRIYLVTAAGVSHLVRATNRAQAMNHIARATIQASVATQDELLALAGKVAVVAAVAEAE